MYSVMVVNFITVSCGIQPNVAVKVLIIERTCLINIHYVSYMVTDFYGSTFISRSFVL